MFWPSGQVVDCNILINLGTRLAVKEAYILVNILLLKIFIGNLLTLGLYGLRDGSLVKLDNNFRVVS